MAQGFRFCARNCLEWSVDKPFYDSPRKSPTFSYSGFDWYFSLTVSYISTYEYEYELTLVNKELKASLIKCGLAVIKTTNEGILISSVNSYYYSAGKYILFKRVMKTKEFGTHARWTVYYIFPDTFPCDIHIKGSETNRLTTLPDSKGQHSSTPSNILMNAKLAASAPYDSQSSFEILSYDLNKLLEQKSLSDVTLTCGGRTFFAHRIILTARSEVFASMFQNNMVESKTGNIDITDIDAEVLDILLKYVYRGKVSDLTVNTADKLYMAADKYSIQSLKDECSKWMLGNLTKENCLNFLYLADACSDERFKERLINFVVQILDLFVEGDEWQQFSDKYPKLAMGIYHKRVLCTKPV